MVTKQEQLEWLAKECDEWPVSGEYFTMNRYAIGACVHAHVITREEWQQERDKMQNQQDNSWHERGELPPVGCECEFAPKSGGKWVKVAIVAVTNQNVIMLVNGESRELVSRISNVIFSPLRTEREKAIDDMATLAMDCKKYDITQNVAKSVCELLYDAGYRKQ